MIINGIPTVNFTCFVLCLNRYIPIYIPIPPRIKAIKKSVFSFNRKVILKLPCQNFIAW